MSGSPIPMPPSAERQQQELWSAVLAHNEGHKTELEKDSRKWPGYETVMSDIKNADYSDTLRCPHDLRPRDVDGEGGRRRGNHAGDKANRKTLCPHGVVCRARMELFPHPSSLSSAPYTGLLTPGATVEHCLVRLSSAMKPPRDEVTSKVGKAFLRAAGDKLRNARLFPCAAVKAPRSMGVRSGNLLFAGCKVGQPERDYFAHPQCTQLTERVAKPLKPFVRKFWTYSDYPLSLGVSDFCSHDANGKEAEEKDGRSGVHFPFCLILNPVGLRPTDEGRENEAGSPVSEGTGKVEEPDFDSFLDEMQSIPKGTILFDLFACPDPASVPDPSKLQRIGRLTSTSEMVLSLPDDGLFFRHQKKEEDYDLRPHWKKDVQEKCSPDEGKTSGTVAKLAGWELFEGHIAKGEYADFEALTSKVSA